MTFLKKLGQIILKATEIFAGFAPIVQTEFPGLSGTVQTVSNDLAQIANIVVAVEAAGQSLNIPGADKLKAAAPQVAQIILKSALLVNHKIANPDLFQQGSTKIADGVADILNSLHDNIDTQSMT
jgi:hypothetical protein